jgi:hypothetical protein
MSLFCFQRGRSRRETLCPTFAHTPAPTTRIKPWPLCPYYYLRGRSRRETPCPTFAHTHPPPHTPNYSLPGSSPGLYVPITIYEGAQDERRFAPRSHHTHPPPLPGSSPGLYVPITIYEGAQDERRFAPRSRTHTHTPAPTTRIKPWPLCSYYYLRGRSRRETLCSTFPSPPPFDHYSLPGSSPGLHVPFTSNLRAPPTT